MKFSYSYAHLNAICKIKAILKLKEHNWMPAGSQPLNYLLS